MIILSIRLVKSTNNRKTQLNNTQTRALRIIIIIIIRVISINKYTFTWNYYKTTLVNACKVHKWVRIRFIVCCAKTFGRKYSRMIRHQINHVVITTTSEIKFSVKQMSFDVRIEVVKTRCYRSKRVTSMSKWRMASEFHKIFYRNKVFIN